MGWGVLRGVGKGGCLSGSWAELRSWQMCVCVLGGGVCLQAVHQKQAVGPASSCRTRSVLAQLLHIPCAPDVQHTRCTAGGRGVARLQGAALWEGVCVCVFSTLQQRAQAAGVRPCLCPFPLIPLWVWCDVMWCAAAAVPVQVISPHQVMGIVEIVEHLSTVQDKVYDEPTVLVVDNVTGVCVLLVLFLFLPHLQPSLAPLPPPYFCCCCCTIFIIILTNRRGGDP